MPYGQIIDWSMNINQRGIYYQKMQQEDFYPLVKYSEYKSRNRYHKTAISAKAETVPLTILTVELNLYSNQIPGASKNSNSRHRFYSTEHQPGVLIPQASTKLTTFIRVKGNTEKDTSAT